MTPYPTTLPIDCFKTVTEVIRNRQLAQRSAEFAQCLWNVQGFLQGLVLGSPSPHGTFGAAAGVAEANLRKARGEASNDERLRNLGEELQSFHGELMGGSFAMNMAAASPESRAIGDGTILKILMQSIPAIIQLLIQLGIIKVAGMAPMTGIAHGAEEGEGTEQTRETNQQQSEEAERASAGSSESRATNEASMGGPAVTGPEQGKSGQTTGEGTKNDVRTQSGQAHSTEEAKSMGRSTHPKK